MTIRMVRVTNANKERNGIVTNPNHSKNLVVQEIPATHGAAASGNIFQYSKLWKIEMSNPGIINGHAYQ